MKRRKKEIKKELIELGVDVQKIKEVSKDDEERKECEDSERLEWERERLEQEERGMKKVKGWSRKERREKDWNSNIWSKRREKE